MYELLPLYRKVFRAEGRGSIYYGCYYSKACTIIQGVSHLDYSLFSSLWPGGKFCRITTDTSRFRNCLYPQTACILNCQSSMYWQTNWTVSQHYKMSIFHTNNTKQILNNWILFTLCIKRSYFMHSHCTSDILHLWKKHTLHCKHIYGELYAILYMHHCHYKKKWRPCSLYIRAVN